MPPEAGSTMRNAERKNPLVIGCGALAPELVELTRRAGLPAMDLTCLPASLHNRPERIPAAVADRIRRAREDGYDRIFVAYADCGTGGLLDPILEGEGVAAEYAVEQAPHQHLQHQRPELVRNEKLHVTPFGRMGEVPSVVQLAKWTSHGAGWAAGIDLQPR